MQSNITVPVDILVYAVRYALGRHTYAPTIIEDAIVQNLDKLDYWIIDKIITEVEDELRRTDEAKTEIGVIIDDINREEWAHILDILKQERSMRID